MISLCNNEIRPHDIFWNPADYAWAGPLFDLILPVFYYGKTLLTYSANDKFDPEKAFQLIEDYRLTNLLIPPTALRMMKQVQEAEKKFNLNSVRVISSGSESFGKALPEWIKKTFNERYPGWYLDQQYQVVPLDKIYFDQSVEDSCRHGNYTQLFLLSGIGMLILIIAIINFINLSIAKSAQRSLEIGIRKVIGANRQILIGQFLIEASLISLFAMCISIFLIDLFIPEFNRFFYLLFA